MTPLKVLLVDDNEDMLELFSLRFRGAGAHVDTADSGPAAIDAVRTANKDGAPFNMVVMDVRMPGMTGMSASKHLRDAGFNGMIVAFTAAPSGLGRTEGAECGVDIYLDKKTVKPEVIAALLEQAREDLG